MREDSIFETTAIFSAVTSLCTNYSINLSSAAKHPFRLKVNQKCKEMFHNHGYAVQNIKPALSIRFAEPLRQRYASCLYDCRKSSYRE